MNRSDQQLVEAYLAGDRRALEILIKRYLKPVYNFARRYVGDPAAAEDVTQIVFVKVWRHLKKFDRRKNFKTWLFSIAKNSCIDAWRKRKDAPFSAFENEDGENPLLATLVDPAPQADEICDRRGLAATLNEAISRLSRQYQQVLAYRYNEQFTFREIAVALAEPLNTVKSRHRRALLQLRKLLPRP